MTEKDILYRQGSELLPAIAYGDAAGLPFETNTAEEIAQAYSRVYTLHPTSLSPLFANKEKPGGWSDDTQLSVAVSEALIAANGFDIDAMAETHIKAYDDTKDVYFHGRTRKQGWGKSTEGAIEALKNGTPPAESGVLDGAGNGVLMKLAPLAYWQTVRSISDDERAAQYDALTTMTHDSDTARLTTRVHGDVLKHLMTTAYDKDEFLEMLRVSVAHHQFETKQFGVLHDAVKYIDHPLSTEKILHHTDKKGFYAPQTLAMAYGAFVLHYGDFKNSVYEAVNLGGDTDSTAAVVAGMSTFKNKETLRMPLDYTHIEKLGELKTLSQKLAQTAFLF